MPRDSFRSPSRSLRHIPAQRSEARKVSLRSLAAKLIRAFDGAMQRVARRNTDRYIDALCRKDARIRADIDAARERAQPEPQVMEQALARAWLARHPVGTFHAGYQGRRNAFRTTPLVGLPTHMQYL